MSPPRRAAAQETRDPLERILDNIDEMRRELADVKQTLERRLVPVEAAVGSIANHESRLKALEERAAEARGAAWMGRVVWLALGAAIPIAGWVLTYLHR